MTATTPSTPTVSPPASEPGRRTASQDAAEVARLRHALIRQTRTIRHVVAVLDADIEACFDSISHTALMDRVRARVKDKRVLALVKAFLKAGILTELGDQRDDDAGSLLERPVADARHGDHADGRRIVDPA